MFLISYGGFTQDFKGFQLYNASIPLPEIKDGGPGKDGIPAIDAPRFIKASQARLKNKDRVLGVFENGIAKAYPILILNYHEIVNDRFEDKPVVVTYCPLCGSGMAFDGIVGDKTLTFGVSGLLYNSDVLLYDRETESLWSQLESKAVSGPMLGSPLHFLNTANTTWKNWKKQHPETLVLSDQTGFFRDYTKDPYPGYDTSSSIYFSVSHSDTRFHPKEMVLGLEIEGHFKAYPFSELEKNRETIIEDSFQGKVLRIIYNNEAKSAEIFDSANNTIPAVTNFWFAWYTFHPNTEVYFH
ncbi:DUF3179 domain-containing protein [Arenibacter sp. GZD96]|uniref:DUF3179 domain-containing protein n=1 Tax=Aurantibrevibacter litoralis TaxID=3106030 RepID=UPI002B002116|nr:DUF3179 domain-containing protein [Arenibacter sp. GZD-96]MEA1785171.1 DUF3179 domain-containing protein [Arenibacter sp. GZD-96]